MTKKERIWGFLLLPCYLVLFAALIGWIDQLLGLKLNDFYVNLIWFGLNFLCVLIIFRRYLGDQLRQIGIWTLLEQLVCSMVVYFGCLYILAMLRQFFPSSVANLNNDAVDQLAAQSLPVTCVLCLVAAPVIEEVLFRGLLFDTFRKAGLVPAYAVSILCFGAAHIWQYLPQYGWKAGIVLLDYIPAGIALCRIREKTQTIWGSILLHAVINLLTILGW